MSQRLFALGYHLIGPNEEAYRAALAAPGLAEAARIYRGYPSLLEPERPLARLAEPVRLWLLLTEAEGFTAEEAAQVVGKRPVLPEEAPCSLEDPHEEHLAGCLTCLRRALPALKAPPAPLVELRNPWTRPRQLVGALVLVASLCFGSWVGLRFYRAAYTPVPQLLEHSGEFYYLPEEKL